MEIAGQRGAAKASYLPYYLMQWPAYSVILHVSYQLYYLTHQYLQYVYFILGGLFNFLLFHLPQLWFLKELYLCLAKAAGVKHYVTLNHCIQSLVSHIPVSHCNILRDVQNKMEKRKNNRKKKEKGSKIVTNYYPTHVRDMVFLYMLNPSRPNKIIWHLLTTLSFPPFAVPILGIQWCQWTDLLIQ